MISPNFAAQSLLIIFALLFIFHLLILFKVISPNIVWAGKIKNQKDLVKFEIISLGVLILAGIIIALKMDYLNHSIKPTFINIGIWILFAFFCLNTLGNLTAKHPFEKYGFGLLTFLISLLIFRLAIFS